MNERQVPVLAEILVAREDDAAIGAATESGHDFEPVDEPSSDALAPVAGAVPGETYASGG